MPEFDQGYEDHRDAWDAEWPVDDAVYGDVDAWSDLDVSDVAEYRGE